MDEPRGRGARGASVDAPASGPPGKGWVSLYAAAFALMLVAAIALMASSLGSLRSIGLLWISSALSLLAAGLAVASVLVPRRGWGGAPPPWRPSSGSRSGPVPAEPTFPPTRHPPPRPPSRCRLPPRSPRRRPTQTVTRLPL